MLDLDALAWPRRGMLRRRHGRRHAPEHRACLAGRLSASRGNNWRRCCVPLLQLDALGARCSLLRRRRDRRHAPEHRRLGRRRRGLRCRRSSGLLRQVQVGVQRGSLLRLVRVRLRRTQLRQPGRQLSGAEGRQRELARRLSSLREPSLVLRSTRANLSSKEPRRQAPMSTDDASISARLVAEVAFAAGAHANIEAVRVDGCSHVSHLRAAAAAAAHGRDGHVQRHG